MVDRMREEEDKYLQGYGEEMGKGDREKVFNI